MDKLEERPDYRRGQWNAFDRVLALLNGMTTDEPVTQDQMRRRVYGEVMSLKPDSGREDLEEITRLKGEVERLTDDLDTACMMAIKAEQSAQQKQALIDELVEGLEGLFRFANGVRYTMTLGKTQIARIEAAAALIPKARSSGKAGSDV